MQLAKLLIFIGLTTSLLGCASTARYEASLDNWVGRTSDDLIIRWGPPSATFELSDEGMVYSYEKHIVQPKPSYHPTYLASRLYLGHFANYPYGASPGYVRTYGCTTNFVIDPHMKIVSWNYQGNACRYY